MSYYLTQQRLRKYFADLFPYATLARFLQDASCPPSHRELSFSMLKESGQEIYRRYVCVDDFTTELRARILDNTTVPHKFDIGGVYNRPVRARDDVLESRSLRCLRREFVLDIDMNDYDALRTCCQGKTVCTRCWLYIAVAAEILSSALQNHFGWQQILLIFSGRRGLHVWCRDPAAMALEPEVRSSIVSYLSIDVENLTSARQLDRLLDQKYIQETLALATEHWQQFLVAQDPFMSSGGTESAAAPNERSISNMAKLRFYLKNHAPASVSAKLDEAILLKKLNTSVLLWNHLSNDLENKRALDLVKLWFLAPRLDKGVSRDKKHLLKAPMVIHQATGFVCCPLVLAGIHKFDPQQDSPTITALCDGDTKALAQFNQFCQILEDLIEDSTMVAR